MKIYQSYVFRKKDPCISELQTIIEDEVGDRIKRHHLKRIEEDGGPSSSAMRSWFFGTTRRPQSATLEAAGRAVGHKRVWVKMNGTTKQKKD